MARTHRRRLVAPALAVAAAAALAPAAPAALAPEQVLTPVGAASGSGVALAVDGTGRGQAVLGVDPDLGGAAPSTIRLATRATRGARWVLQPGDRSGPHAFGPSLAIDGQRVVLAWLVDEEPTTRAFAATSDDGTIPTGTGTELTTGSPQVAVIATAVADVPVVAFRDAAAGAVGLRTWRGVAGWSGAFGAPGPIPSPTDASPPRLVAIAGHAYLLAMTTDAGVDSLRFSAVVAGGSLTPGPVLASGAVGAFDAAAAGGRAAVAWAVPAAGRVRVVARRAAADAATTATLRTLPVGATVPANGVKVAATPDGSTLVVWIESSPGGAARVLASRSLRGGAFSSPIAVSLPGAPAYPEQLAAAGVPGGGFVATWGRADGYQWGVEGMRVPASGPIPRVPEAVARFARPAPPALVGDGTGGVLIGTSLEARVPPGQDGTPAIAVRRWGPDAVDPPLRIGLTRAVMGGDAAEDAVVARDATFAELARRFPLQAWARVGIDVRAPAVVHLVVRRAGCLLGFRVPTPRPACAASGAVVARTDVRIGRAGLRLLPLRSFAAGHLRVGSRYVLTARATIRGRTVGDTVGFGVDGPEGSGGRVIR